MILALRTAERDSARGVELWLGARTLVAASLRVRTAPESLFVFWTEGSVHPFHAGDPDRCTDPFIQLIAGRVVDLVTHDIDSIFSSVVGKAN